MYTRLDLAASAIAVFAWAEYVWLRIYKPKNAAGGYKLRLFEARNAHFDRLVNTADLRWMGQNTNHLPPHPSVIAAAQASLKNEEFHVYAPPAGFEALRAGIVEDLGLPGQVALVSDGAVASLYHACHTFLRPGDELITTDPTWNWPVAFAKSVGATVKQIPIYGEEFGYRLAPERLKAAITERTKIIYIVDPNNPLGSSCSAEEIQAIADIAKASRSILIHDCTYRDFAYNHTLAARFFPEQTLTVYSFSKWLGLAGLRVGALVGHPDLIEKLAAAPPNNLGSSIVSQRAAMAGLAIKKEWFPSVLTAGRENQKLIKDAVDAIPGLVMPVYPSNGNFVVIECTKAGVSPEALCAAFSKHNILIRQGSYHTPVFGDRFIKVSISVPRKWVEEFITLLPSLVDEVRGRNEPIKLF
jgi:aspartate/methionine/tyrosine aminotransferase